MEDNFYLPRCTSQQIGIRFIGMFKIFERQEWRVVLDKEGKKRYFDTDREAYKAAETVLKKIINGKIRAERMTDKPIDPLEAEAAGWRKRKDSEATQERQRVFNAPAKTVFAKGVRSVQHTYSFQSSTTI